MTTVKINNEPVVNFLYEQTVVKNVSTVDYLTSLVLNEIECLEIKKDIKVLESEVKQVNEGKMKPRSARLTQIMH